MTGDAAAVAADTNLIRHPTPRRYLTALEMVRGRRVAILPMVDRELRVQLPRQAAAHIRGLCGQGGTGAGETGAAASAAARAALEWGMMSVAATAPRTCMCPTGGICIMLVLPRPCRTRRFWMTARTTTRSTPRHGRMALTSWQAGTGGPF